MDWGHDQQCRVRVFLHGISCVENLLPLERVLHALRPSRYMFQLNVYLHDPVAALHDVWLSEEKLKESRRPKGDTFICKEVEEARMQYLFFGLEWPCCFIFAVFPSGLCEVSEDPDVWQMLRGSLIN